MSIFIKAVTATTNDSGSLLDLVVVDSISFFKKSIQVSSGNKEYSITSKTHSLITITTPEGTLNYTFNKDGELN